MFNYPCQRKNIGSCALPEGCESSADAVYMLQNYMSNEKTPKKPTYTGGDSPKPSSSHDDKNGSSIDSLSENARQKHTQKKISCVHAAANKINPARSLSKGLQEESERKGSTMYLSDQLSGTESNSCRLRDPLSSRRHVVIAVASFSNDLANYRCDGRSFDTVLMSESSYSSIRLSPSSRAAKRKDGGSAPSFKIAHHTSPRYDSK